MNVTDRADLGRVFQTVKSSIESAASRPLDTQSAESHSIAFHGTSRFANDDGTDDLAAQAIADMWRISNGAVNLAFRTFEDDREARGLVHRSLPYLSSVALMSSDAWDELKTSRVWQTQDASYKLYWQQAIPDDQYALTDSSVTGEKVIHYSRVSSSSILQARETSELSEYADRKSGCPAHGNMLNRTFSNYVDAVFFPQFNAPNNSLKLAR